MGLLLYGVRPAAAPGRRAHAGHDPLDARGARAGDARRGAVGYAALWRAAGRPASPRWRWATPTGSRSRTSNRGQVWLRGRRLPLVGRVSMDYVAVDAGDAPVEIGDEAIVFGAGAGPLPVEEAAVAAQTLALRAAGAAGRAGAANLPVRVRARARSSAASGRRGPIPATTPRRRRARRSAACCASTPAGEARGASRRRARYPNGPLPPRERRTGAR